MSEYIVKCTEVTGISGNLIMVPDFIDLNSEIVRCRDCKYYVEASRDYGVRTFCDYLDGVSVEPDGFCAWAERRTE